MTGALERQSSGIDLPLARTQEIVCQIQSCLPKRQQLRPDAWSSAIALVMACHIGIVRVQIFEERPAQAVDLLETSYLVKRSKGRSDAGYDVEPSQVWNLANKLTAVQRPCQKFAVRLSILMRTGTVLLSCGLFWSCRPSSVGQH